MTLQTFDEFRFISVGFNGFNGFQYITMGCQWDFNWITMGFRWILMDVHRFHTPNCSAHRGLSNSRRRQSLRPPGRVRSMKFAASRIAARLLLRTSCARAHSACARAPARALSGSRMSASARTHINECVRLMRLGDRAHARAHVPACMRVRVHACVPARVRVGACKLMAACARTCCMPVCVPVAACVPA